MLGTSTSPAQHSSITVACCKPPCFFHAEAPTTLQLQISLSQNLLWFPSPLSQSYLVRLQQWESAHYPSHCVVHLQIHCIIALVSQHDLTLGMTARCICIFQHRFASCNTFQHRSKWAATKFLLKCCQTLSLWCTGICRQGPESHHMWYRRSFTIPQGWAGQQVLLHFGAVDWQAHVWVNNVQMGTHCGG